MVREVTSRAASPRAEIENPNNPKGVTTMTRSASPTQSLFALTLATALLATCLARAAIINNITWLEVDSENSTVASGAIEDEVGIGDPGDDSTDGVNKDDDNWDYIRPFGVIGVGDSDQRTTALGTGMLANGNHEDFGDLTVTYPGILDPGIEYTVYVAFRIASESEGVEVSLDKGTTWHAHAQGGADYGDNGSIDVAAANMVTLGTDDGGNDYIYAPDGINGSTITGVSDLSLLFRDPTDNPVGEPAGRAWTWCIIDTIGVSPAPIPEPASLALLLLGSAALGAHRRRRSR
jgi:hypothetical protein